jgi:UDP-N-acetylglucosamine acyltransferase
MTSSHVAHNCRVEDDVILATGAALGGHVSVGERAFISGNAVVHQHTRIGRFAMLQGGCGVSRDVPPFCIAAFGLNIIRGVNVVGLRRGGFSRTQIDAVRRAFRALFLRRQNLRLATERLLAAEGERGGPTAEVQEMLDFIAAARRGVCFGPKHGGASADGATDA